MLNLRQSAKYSFRILVLGFFVFPLIGLYPDHALSQTIPSMAAYGERDQLSPRFRLWDDTAWSAETSAIEGPAMPKTIVLKSSTTRDEKILGVLDANHQLSLQVWSGASWGNRIVATSSSGPTTHPSRSFDIGYEKLSGDALIVYGETGTHFPRYRIWDGAAWSSPATVPITKTSGIPVWVKLASKPAGDEILLVYQDTNNDINALVWNGSEFAVVVVDGGPVHPFERLVEANTTTSTAQTFDAAYDSQLGTAMVAWARAGSATPRFRIWDGTQWGSEQSPAQSAATATTALHFVRLEADPSASRMALGTGDAASDLYVQVLSFDGASWTATGNGAPFRLTDNLAFNRYQRSFDFAWQATNSKLIGAYGVLGIPGGSYRIWDPASGWGPAGGLLPSPSTSDTAIIQLRSHPTRNEAQAALLSSADALSFVRWSGSAWTDQLQSEPVSSASDSIWDSATGSLLQVYSEAYMLAYDQHLLADVLAITDVTPGGLRQGATGQQILIGGRNFLPGATVSFGTASGIFQAGTTNATAIPTSCLPSDLSCDQLRILVDIGPLAPVGPKVLTVANPAPDNRQATGAGLFEVLPMPILTSASPGTVGQGAEGRLLTISGDGFQSGAVVGFSGSGVAVPAVCRLGLPDGCYDYTGIPTRIQVEINVDPSAPVGLRDLTVTNPNSQANTLASAFEITAAPQPQSVTPSSRPKGSVGQEITVTGLNFQPGADLDLSRVARDLVKGSNFTFSDTNAIGIESGILRLKSQREFGLFPSPFTGFGFRKQIQVKHSGTTPLASGYSVRYVLDHAALVEQGDSLSDGNDIRIGYCPDPPTCSSWQELDRFNMDAAGPTGWNQANTEIWFKTQASIPAGGSDNRYFLYFGNSTATAAPADPNQVFVLYDDFQGGISPLWVESGSNAETLTIVNGRLRIPGGDLITRAVSGLVPGAVWMQYEYGFDRDNRGVGCNQLGTVGIRPHQFQQTLYLPYPIDPICPRFLSHPGIRVVWGQGQLHQLRQEWWGLGTNQYRLTVVDTGASATMSLSNNNAINDVVFSGGDSADTGPALLDNVLIRKLAVPEPTVVDSGFSSVFQTATTIFGGGQISEWTRLEVITTGASCPTCRLQVKYASRTDGTEPVISEAPSSCTTRCTAINAPGTAVIPLDAATDLANPPNNRLAVRVELKGSDGGESRSLQVTELRLRFKATDISIGTCVISGTSQLACSVDSSLDTLEGFRDVAVTNPDGGTGSLEGGFEVTPAIVNAPTLSGVSPATVTQGEVERILTITGTGFAATPRVVFSSPDIVPVQVTLIDSATLKVKVNVAQTASPGTYSLSVINPDGRTAPTTLNVSIQSLSELTISSGTTVTLNCESSQWAYTNLTIAPGGTMILGCDSTLKVYGSIAIEATGSSQFGRLIVNSGTGQITIDAGTVTIQSSARIHANGAGHSGGSPGTSGGGPGGGGLGQGGSYGGLGGGTSNSSLLYGSLAQPTDPGSGGGGGATLSSSFGGTGGGAVRIKAGTLTLNGFIWANGLSGQDQADKAAGGGSGGSIWVEVGTLQGNGHFEAIGGKGGGGGTSATSIGGGGGAGGRIAVYYTGSGTGNGTLINNSTVAGGAGGTGTAGVAGSPGQPGSLLFVDQQTVPSVVNVGGNGLLDHVLDVVPSIQSLVVRRGGSSGAANRDIGTITLSRNLTIGSNLTVRNASKLLLSGDISLNTGNLFINDPGTQLIMDSSQAAVGLKVANLEISPNAGLVADGTGHRGGSRIPCMTAEGPGAGSGEFDPARCASGTSNTDISGAGGGYGGKGGNARFDALGTFVGGGGAVYGSPEMPLDMGSGGGRSFYGRAGGNGGGAIMLEVSGTLTLNGLISANGLPGAGGNGSRDYGGGGGSGGSIYAIVNTLQGAGRFEARGGNGGQAGSDSRTPGAAGGGGGGGRMDITYTSIGSAGFTGFTCPQDALDNASLKDAVYCVSGGSGNGGIRAGAAGSILFRQVADSSSAGDVTAPSSPGSLTATVAGSSQINLGWTASTDDMAVTGYRVERCRGTGCTNFALVAAVTSTSYSDLGLAGGTVYRYRVRAVDAAVNLSAYSNLATATTTPPPDTSAPSAPTSLEAIAVGTTEVSLSWGASTDNVGVTGYRLERCQGGTCTNYAEIATPSGTTYLDKGLLSTTTYRYRVRARDAAGNTSAYSNIAAATTLQDVAPQAIDDLKAVISTITSNSVVLEWTARQDDTPSEPAAAYDIRYSVRPIDSGNFTSATAVAQPPVPQNPGSKVSFKVSGLKANTTYYFAIQAEDETGKRSGIGTLINSNLDPGCTSGCRLLTALRLGWNLVSVAGQPQAPGDTADAVFGDDVGLPVNLLRWNSTGSGIGQGGWDALGSASVGGSNGPIIAGQGYFLFSPGNLSVLDLESSATAVSSPYEVSLDPDHGFNLVGNPFSDPILLQDVCIRVPGAAVSKTFADAASSGDVSNVIYIWRDDQDAYDWKTLSDNPLLLPWQGYGILVLNQAGHQGAYSVIFKDVTTTPTCP